MRKLVLVTFLITTVLPLSALAAAATAKKPKLVLNAHQIFEIYSSAAKKGRAEQRKAEVFVQRVLDGKIYRIKAPAARLQSLTGASATGGNACHYSGECDAGHNCIECSDSDCWCSSCCGS